eukprot:scaffold1062_cov130-Cylindrotheca_fusiformis.AAC.6
MFGWTNNDKKRALSALQLVFLLSLNVLSERQVAFLLGNTGRIGRVGWNRECEGAVCNRPGNIFFTAKGDHEIEKKIEENRQLRFSDSLVRSLDLAPLARLVASHAATRRGFRAILSIVGENNKATKTNPLLSRTKQTPQSRQKRVSDIFGGLPSSQTEMDSTTRGLMQIAASADEARKEYELVEQATSALSDNPYNFTFPPLYGHYSNPMDTETIPETDDDEWLYLPPDAWTLESIIQSEQVIDTLQKVKAWAELDESKLWMPALSAIALGIDPDYSLQEVHSEIQNAVNVVRAKTAVPTARGAFSFRLNDDKFPVLKLLRTRRDTILRRGGKELDTDVVEIEDEINTVESQIRTGLAQRILSVSNIVDEGIYRMSRLDVVFARAAFGVTMNGMIPILSNDGRLSVNGFVHRLLGSGCGASLNEAIPIDLLLSSENGGRCLVITGPNGGGKTLALKSFGVVATFVKLGIPIPLEHGASSKPRVDFFNTVLANFGDQQNIAEGESTWSGMLHSCASIIAKVSEASRDENILVLLDELGSGTDPEAGGAIAQALLEQMLSSSSCYVVATTHSPRLKVLSYRSQEITCASVLLKGVSSSNGYKLPSFQLQYGVIGESYAMGAMTRCDPALPDSVLSRASQLMAESVSKDGVYEGGYFRVLTESMEKQLQQSICERRRIEQNSKDSAKCRSAMVSLASSYEQHLSRLESRLDKYFQQMKKQGKDNFDLVGETVAELRIVKRRLLGQKERLRERGLRLLPASYDLTVGESIVLVAEGELDGSAVKVLADSATNSTLGPDKVLVQTSSSFFGWNDPLDEAGDGDEQFVVPRHELAIWDYESAWDEESDSVSPVATPSDSKRRLTSLLSSMKSTPSATRTKEANGNKEGSTFTSARDRKAAKRKSKKKGKKKKQ